MSVITYDLSFHMLDPIDAVVFVVVMPETLGINLDGSLGRFPKMVMKMATLLIINIIIIIIIVIPGDSEGLKNKRILTAFFCTYLAVT